MSALTVGSPHAGQGLPLASELRTHASQKLRWQHRMSTASRYSRSHSEQRRCAGTGASDGAASGRNLAAFSNASLCFCVCVVCTPPPRPRGEDGVAFEEGGKGEMG